ncbi:hypothetical protein SB758_31685, partial [Burkholderia sp. SIMBA_013]
ASNNDRLASLPRLERASRILALVNQELLAALDAARSDGNGLDMAATWGSLERFAPKEQILGAVATVTELVPDDDGSAETSMRVALAEKYRTVRPFLALLAGNEVTWRITSRFRRIGRGQPATRVSGPQNTNQGAASRRGR